LLRCNFLMRGVLLAPGTHRIEFQFRPSLRPLMISTVAIVVGLGLLGFLCLETRRKPSTGKPDAELPSHTVRRACRAAIP